jgi:hypothetical protein
VGGVLIDFLGVATVIRLAVIVLPLAVPATCTVVPTGNCCAVPGARLVPNCVWDVMVTVYVVPFLALTVQVESFSPVGWPGRRVRPMIAMGNSKIRRITTATTARTW